MNSDLIKHKKVLLLIDVANLYHTLLKTFNGKFNYGKFYQFFEEHGTIHRAIAFGAQLDDEASSFISFLQHTGYEVRIKKVKVFDTGQKKANCDIDIAVEAIKTFNDCDIVVLVSSDGDFASLVEFIQSRGKRCFIYGCGISEDLQRTADESFEIDESLIQ